MRWVRPTHDVVKILKGMPFQIGLGRNVSSEESVSVVRRRASRWACELKRARVGRWEEDGVSSGRDGGVGGLEDGVGSEEDGVCGEEDGRRTLSVVGGTAASVVCRMVSVVRRTVSVVRRTVWVVWRTASRLLCELEVGDGRKMGGGRCQ